MNRIKEIVRIWCNFFCLDELVVKNVDIYEGIDFILMILESILKVKFYELEV